MVRVAKVYLKEGNLESAYVLYIKFMTLFIEKIRKHPEYSDVSSQLKLSNQAKLKEVIPEAEELKLRLLQKYRREILTNIRAEVNRIYIVIADYLLHFKPFF